MGQKILLIDDSVMLRRIAANILHSQPAHYEVIAATRASEGFARACGGVGLIVVDYRIAGSAEGDFCRRLLSEPRTTRVPVLLLAGRGTALPELGSLPANVVETLRKPFTPEQLVGVVNAIFDFVKAGAGLGELRARLHPALPTDQAAVSIVAEAAPSLPTRKASTVESALSPAADSVQHTPAKSEDPIVFRNNAEANSLRTTLQTVASEGLSGVLRFFLPDHAPTEVFFEGGHLVVVTTKDCVAYSEGATEVLPAKVSPATLEIAIAEQCRSGTPFFLSLGSRGLLSKAAAVALLHRFGQRQFARLWLMRPAQLKFEFKRLEALPGFALRLETRREPVDEWLLGSLRCIGAEELADRSRHEGLVGTPTYHRKGEAILQSLKLTDMERGFARLVNGRTDLPTIAKALALPPENAFLMLFRFRCLEAMDYRPAPAAFVVTPRTNVRRVLPLKR